MKALFDSLRGGQSQMELGPRVGREGEVGGPAGRLPALELPGHLRDEDGQEQEMWPENAVSLISGAMQGVRAYAAIRDPRAGLAVSPGVPEELVRGGPPGRVHHDPVGAL
jgi:hypothetical protein